ncbi:hypothetical protein C1S81_07230 [Mycolicibacterium neoaurum]|nr:hypothetical protein C1S81_07230 [Mycolicibacterium neoaurum]
MLPTVNETMGCASTATPPRKPTSSPAAAVATATPTCWRRAGRLSAISCSCAETCWWATGAVTSDELVGSPESG